MDPNPSTLASSAPAHRAAQVACCSSAGEWSSWEPGPNRRISTSLLRAPGAPTKAYATCVWGSPGTPLITLPHTGSYLSTTSTASTSGNGSSAGGGSSAGPSAAAAAAGAAPTAPPPAPALGPGAAGLVVAGGDREVAALEVAALQAKASELAALLAARDAKLTQMAKQAKVRCWRRALPSWHRWRSRPRGAHAHAHARECMLVCGWMGEWVGVCGWDTPAVLTALLLAAGDGWHGTQLPCRPCVVPCAFQILSHLLPVFPAGCTQAPGCRS